MENNDPDGRYKQFLDSTARGEIQNPDDLQRVAQKMNTTGKYNELLKQIKNPNLEMLNMKKWLEMNNDDGRYNHLLQEMARNPDFNKLDLLNYIEKGNSDGKYDRAKAKMNYDTLADEAVHFMKKNNKPGTYSSILENQVGMRHPKMSSLIGYANQKTEHMPLKEKLNEVQAKK